MHYTVYLDLLFLVNFTVDLWILLLEQKLLRFSASGFRLALGAAFGSGWVCFLVLVPLPPFWEQVLSFVVAAAGIQWVTFSIHSGKTMAKSVAVFYFFAFLFGGIFSAVAERTGGVPASLLISGGSLIGFAMLIGVSWFQERRRAEVISVELTWNNPVGERAGGYGKRALYEGRKAGSCVGCLGSIPLETVSAGRGSLGSLPKRREGKWIAARHCSRYHASSRRARRVAARRRIFQISCE